MPTVMVERNCVVGLNYRFCSFLFLWLIDIYYWTIRRVQTVCNSVSDFICSVKFPLTIWVHFGLIFFSLLLQ